jgi:hypothetical protein
MQVLGVLRGEVSGRTVGNLVANIGFHSNWSDGLEGLGRSNLNAGPKN